MPRAARLVICNVPHHCTQRGNNRQIVFDCDDDRLIYLDLLGRYCCLYGVAILGYCLMSNHTHTIAVPRFEDSLADALGDTHGRYAQHWNAKRRTAGHVWQARFYSAPMDTQHFLDTLRYTELNPVRARMVELATHYPWSSARAHCTGHDDSGLLNFDLWS